MTKIKYDEDVHEQTQLKKRRAETPVQLKPKGRNKMKIREPNKMPDGTEDMSNFALLTFPTDPHGITSKLKQAMHSAGSRMGTDKKNLQLVLETLEILTEHVQARLAQNKDTGNMKLGKRSDRINAMPEKVVEITYKDMVKALKEAGVELESKKKEYVEKAYAELTKE